MLEVRELVILWGGARGKWKNHGLGGIWVFCVFFGFFIYLFIFLVFEFFFYKSNNLSSWFGDGDHTF